MKNKKALILGVANEKSLAWAIAQAFKNEGAEIAFTYPNEAIKKRVVPLSQELGTDLVFECDVGSDEQIKKMIQNVTDKWGTFDVLVHAVAFAQKEELAAPFIETSRDGFRMALDISAYSLIALCKAAVPHMNSGGAVLTLSYYGANKVVQNYNVMGVAKAALEASVRYLAWDLGPKNIRINSISAGPVKTLAAAGIRGFRSILESVGQMSALRRNINGAEVGKSALYLCSDLASGVTGENHFVDAGFNTGALKLPEVPQS